MKEIPINNWIPLSLTVAFALAAFVFRTPEGIVGNVLLAAGMLLIGFVLFATGIAGAGVVKFFAASSLWMGPHQAFLTFATTSLIGSAVLALIIMRIHGRTASIPVLPAMLLAFILALPEAPIWQAMMAGSHLNVW